MSEQKAVRVVYNNPKTGRENGLTTFASNRRQIAQVLDRHNIAPERITFFSFGEKEYKPEAIAGMLEKIKL